MAGSDKDRVLIAGGGPVGLLSALLLGRAGFTLRLFDVNPALQDDRGRNRRLRARPVARGLQHALP